MPKRDLAAMDKDMFSPIGRLLGQAMSDGLNNDIIQPGMETGQDTMQGVYAESVTQICSIGTRRVVVDDWGVRVFRYASADGTLAAGELQQGAVNGGNTTYQHDLTAAVALAGATTVTFTTITDTLVANAMAGGFLAVTDGPDQGSLYRIVSHAAGAAGALAFVIDRGVTTAWTTSTRVTVIDNPYKNVIQAPVTTPTGPAVGVPVIPVTDNYFFWLQTFGWANCLVKTALTAGVSVIRDVAAAGSVGIQVAGAGSLITEVVGYSGYVADTTDSGLVFLTLAP